MPRVLTLPSLTNSLQSLFSIKYMWLKWNQIEFFPNRLTIVISTVMDWRKLPQFTQKWLDQRFPTFFERDPNLSLVNTSRFKPQTTYEKIMIVWMIFYSKLLNRFQCQQSHRTAVWIASAWSIFWPFLTLLWVSTHALGTTGLDQWTDRCVKLQRHVFPNFNAEPRW